MSLTPIKQAKLKFYRNRLDPMTADEALKYALQAAQTCADVGPFDPAHGRFKQEELSYLEYAELLTDEENEHVRPD